LIHIEEQDFSYSL